MISKKAVTEVTVSKHASIEQIRQRNIVKSQLGNFEHRASTVSLEEVTAAAVKETEQLKERLRGGVSANVGRLPLSRLSVGSAAAIATDMPGPDPTSSRMTYERMDSLKQLKELNLVQTGLRTPKPSPASAQPVGYDRLESLKRMEKRNLVSQGQFKNTAGKTIDLNDVVPLEELRSRRESVRKSRQERSRLLQGAADDSKLDLPEGLSQASTSEPGSPLRSRATTQDVTEVDFQDQQDKKKKRTPRFACLPCFPF